MNGLGLEAYVNLDSRVRNYGFKAHIDLQVHHMSQFILWVQDPSPNPR